MLSARLHTFHGYSRANKNRKKKRKSPWMEIIRNNDLCGILKKKRVVEIGKKRPLSK